MTRFTDVTVGNVLQGIGNTFADVTESFGTLLRPDKFDQFYETNRLVSFSFKLVNQFQEFRSDTLTKLSGVSDTFISALDAFRILHDIGYLLPRKDTSKLIYRDADGKVVKEADRISSREYSVEYGRTCGLVEDLKHNRYFKMLGHLQLLAVLDVVAPLSFFGDHGVTVAKETLDKLGSTFKDIGNTEIFGAKPLESVSNLNIGQVCRGTLIAAVSCFTIHNIQVFAKLSKYKTTEQDGVQDPYLQHVFSGGDKYVKQEKMKTLFEIAGGVAEIGLQTLSFFNNGIIYTTAGVAKTTVGVMGAYYNTPQFLVPMNIAPGA